MSRVHFKKTLIIEQSREYVVQIRSMLKGYLDEVEFCYDGSRALEIYHAFHPDLIFVEAILPKRDGFAIMEHIHGDNLLKIIVTSINQEIIIKKAFQLGADYIFVKPYEQDSFVARLMDIAAHKKENKRYPGFGYLLDDDSVLRGRISSILKSLGIPANVKGYAFLRESILIVLKDISSLNSMKDRIYTPIAEIYDTTLSRTERNIRHAIEMSASRADPEAYEFFFGYSFDSEKGKPTNGEFISAVADKIILGNLPYGGK